MKKILLLLLMLPALLLAAPIGPNLALQVASNFINAPETSSNNAVLRAPRKLKRMARAPKQVTNNQQFYIFNSEDGDGFVIVSADDIAHPILGYSSTGSLDSRDMPENLRWWLSEYNRQVLWAKGNNITQSPEIADEWQQVISNNIIAATPVVSPLVQTIWDQAPYYNNKCPFNYLVMQRTVTGCAATALAQVMNYWQWPTIGDGIHKYNCSFYGTQSANFGATIYDWDYMPNELTHNSTSRQVDAVATLMYHCGVAMDMDYGLSMKYWNFNKGTGSTTGADDVVTAAVNYFRYSATTENAKKQNYSETEWINLIKGQLDAHHPMVYWGIGNGGGHAFVCDGYDSQNMFHFNWGWGGYCNDAYYAVSALIPGPGGIGSGDSGDYTANQGAIINMVPRSTNNSANLQVNSNWYLSSDSIQYGGTIAASVSVKNYGSSSFVGDVVAMVLDKDGNYFADYTIQANCTIPKNGTLTLNPYVSGNAGLIPGRYYVALFYRNNDIGYQIIGSEYYINLATFKVYHHAEIETYSDFAIYSDDNFSLVKGMQAQICVTLKNTGATYFHGETALILYNSDFSDGEDFCAIDMGSAGINTGATRTLTYTGTPHLDPGTYILALLYKDDNGNVHFAGSTYYSNPVYIIVKSDEEEDTGEETEDYELVPGKYVIVANRDKNGDRNWYYMTSDLGTASTKRFQAVSTGTTSIDAIPTNDLEDKYVWTLEADGSNWKLKNGTQYVTWTSGNSAKLGATAKTLTFDVTDNQVLAHFNDGTAERYLSLNATTNNNYFAFYSETSQIEQLFFLPYDEGTTPPTPVHECKSVPYTESFESSQGDFSVLNLTLPSGFTSIWNWDAQYGMVAKCIKGSTKYESESWLISPCIELSADKTCTVSFSHAAKFFQDTKQMSLWISTDYDESTPEKAQWAQLVIPTYPTGANWNWYDSGDINLSEYKGRNVNIAFCYKSNTSFAPQWEIKNFAVKEGVSTAIDNTFEHFPSVKKILRDGQIFIIRGEKVYNAQGALVN